MAEDATKYRPMRPGAQIGNVQLIGGKKGTLTCFVESYAQPRPGWSGPVVFAGSEPKWEKFWITCAHVLGAARTAPRLEHPMTQPAVIIDAFHLNHAGVVRCQAFGGKADAALVLMNDQAISTFSFGCPPYTGGFINTVLKFDINLTGLGNVFNQDRVSMYGMESGVAGGIVLGNGADGSYEWTQSDTAMTGFKVTSDLPLQPGDSGGPVFKTTGELVGVITGADENDMRLIRCCRIHDVLDALSSALTDWYNSTKPPVPATDVNGWKLGLRLVPV